jgi:YD repeat-containing protein
MLLDSAMTPVPTVAYDANGNTLSDPSGKSYTWDFENRLVQAVVPGTNGGTTTFRYDPFGRRIQKSGPLGTTNYLYEGLGAIEDVDSSGNVFARYTAGGGIDEPLTESLSTTTVYYQQDGMNSVTSLSSSSGALASTYTFDSFGNLTASTGTINNRFRYTGRESDEETGTYYYRAQWMQLVTYTNPPLSLYLFKKMVGNKMPWDYKQYGWTLTDFGGLGPSPYGDCGNFNFGASGRAWGIPLPILLRGAGYAQVAAGTSTPEWGHWYNGPPYGDDPDDQAQIIAGYFYYKNGCYKK